MSAISIFNRVRVSLFLSFLCRRRSRAHKLSRSMASSVQRWTRSAAPRMTGMWAASGMSFSKLTPTVGAHGYADGGPQNGSHGACRLILARRVPSCFSGWIPRARVKRRGSEAVTCTWAVSTVAKVNQSPVSQNPPKTREKKNLHNVVTNAAYSPTPFASTWCLRLLVLSSVCHRVKP